MGASRGIGWFAYTLVLHRIREGGTFIKILDLLDERMLTNMETILFAQELLQVPEDQHLSSDPATFCDEVQRLLSGATPVHDVRRNALSPPVDIALLRRRLLPPRTSQCVQWILRCICCRRRARGPPLLPN